LNEAVGLLQGEKSKKHNGMVKDRLATQCHLWSWTYNFT